MFSSSLISIRRSKNERKPLIELDDYLIEMIIEKESPIIGFRAHEFRNELDIDTSLMGYIDENEKNQKFMAITNCLKVKF